MQPNIAEIKYLLRDAVVQCSERALYFGAKWYPRISNLPASLWLQYLTFFLSARAAEALSGIDNTLVTVTSLGTPIAGASHSYSVESPPPLTDLEYDKYLLAKTYFELKEFDRASHALIGCNESRSRFLRLYAKFLAGEKRKEEEAQNIMGPLDNSRAINRELDFILEELRPAFEAGELDAFCLFLYGIVCVKRNAKQLAVEVLVRSVNKYPYNWSAWLELASCISTQEMVVNITPGLPDNFMTKFFLAHVALELHQSPDAIQDPMRDLSLIFPNSSYIKSQRAMACYNLRDFDEAEVIFDELRESDPYRLEHMDIYSNVLYVMDNKAKLSVLANECCNTDKYRPETCCIIGNYYSLRTEHAKAVSYFRRALKLNRGYLPAWTLMGHEYLELKNTNAAIECYRRAADINHRDYRAWYGLGQTYELLKLPMYALFYFQRATALRPYDGRMWCATANCYENLERDVEAIKCYKRALLGSENETLVLGKLAKLYEKLGKRDAAAHYYRLSLELKKMENNINPEIGEAILYLANYESERNNLKEAEAYANDAMQYTGTIREDAKALLRDLKSRTLSNSGEI
ncbi:anaphase promoting complex subunit 8 [Jimgerdemannia flammicorona]|uniref:Anaphase promoting complex subunit 8 n=1 Tax=Jimgerdemannia flammicorona TaxID=994334 RepID=A0A433DCS1_9FUNG|nr:anaphase promoting complex subunit 8 [Jimgerdemannia flammicorona]